jgi:quercetin dioxygenase-like cupin family protein
MEIRRFGIGHRRKDGLPGTHGVEGTPLHTDPRGVVAELVLKANAAVAPHSNPNLTYLVVIEGGGFVQVGDERARVSAGDAVVWPPDVVHAAWTELTPMRAIVVEFAPETGPGQMIQLDAASIAGSRPGDAVEIDRGVGELTSDPPVMPANHVSPEQEPW